MTAKSYIFLVFISILFGCRLPPREEGTNPDWIMSSSYCKLIDTLNLSIGCLHERNLEVNAKMRDLDTITSYCCLNFVPIEGMYPDYNGKMTLLNFTDSARVFALSSHKTMIKKKGVTTSIVFTGDCNHHVGFIFILDEDFSVLRKLRLLKDSIYETWEYDRINRLQRKLQQNIILDLYRSSVNDIFERITSFQSTTGKASTIPEKDLYEWMDIMVL